MLSRSTDSVGITTTGDDPKAAIMPTMIIVQSIITSPKPTTTANRDAKKVFMKFIIIEVLVCIGLFGGDVVLLFCYFLFCSLLVFMSLCLSRHHKGIVFFLIFCDRGKSRRAPNLPKVAFFFIFVVLKHLRMTKKDTALKALDSVVHPETNQGLSSGGFVEHISTESDDPATNSAETKIHVVLKFRRPRDPMAASLRRQAESTLAKTFPGTTISVEIASPQPATPDTEPSRRLAGVKHIVAIASGKGGVGKSTVTAALASILASRGFRVGVLDADIYGPSQPALFGMEDYIPVPESDNPDSVIVPAESGGVKIMSIGFFISPSDALVWRGPMAVNALRQLIRQTAWGELDWLLVDLPPGTGDVHLSVVHELELDGAIIVSTPQSLALADVRRGVEMFRAKEVDVPVLGIVENMAWFTPAEYPDKQYFIFGNGGVENFAAREGIEFLGAIPIVMSAGEKDAPQAVPAPQVRPNYEAVARRIVDKLSERC
jgi:ATP-binding protein involved in chromosome partitioning